MSSGKEVKKEEVKDSNEINVGQEFNFAFISDIETPENTKEVEGEKEETGEPLNGDENNSNRSAQNKLSNRDIYLKNVHLNIWNEIDEEGINWEDDNVLNEIHSVALKTSNKKELSETEEYYKHGGDIDELITLRLKEKEVQNIYNHIADEKSDKSEEAKIVAIRAKYSKIGWTDAKIQKQIELWKSTEGDDHDTMFDDEAFQAIGDIQEAIKVDIQAKIDSAKKAYDETQVKRKEFAETVKSKIEDKQEAKEVYKAFLSHDENTGLTDVDRMYLEMRNNPDKAIELFRFLKDIDAYVKNKTKKDVAEAVIERATKITLKDKKKEEEVSDFFIPFSLNKH